MALPLHVNNRSELNESMRKGPIGALNALCPIIRNEFIVPDKPDFNDVCTKGDDSFYSPNKVAVIKDITINSGDRNGESFIEIWDLDTKKIISTNSTIYEVNNDKEFPKYSQLPSNCDITTHELINPTKLCKATKSLTCPLCSFKCCRKNNLKYHMQNDHKIPINYGITSDSQEITMSKSMKNSSNETSSLDRNKNIDIYCVKCDNKSSPTTINSGQTCELCNSLVIYQCRICKKPYTYRQSIYRHLKNECINIEPQYKCSQCDYKAKQKAVLQRHVKLKHSIKKCPDCGKNFKDSFALRKHQLNECVNKAMLKCYCCSYKSIFKSQLENHIRFEHNSRFTCSKCGKKYINLKHFKNHLKNGCGSEIRYKCNHCSYSTNDKRNLRRHIRNKHSEIFLFGNSL